jgi:uncharacterized membrane protein YbaN (DUF454 family)
VVVLLLLSRANLKFRHWLARRSYIGDVLQTMLDDAATN